jgi:hypothetical protein
VGVGKMKNLDIMIHFGFPKTASSSLQYGLFLPLHKKNKVNLKTWRMTDTQEHLDIRPSSRLFNHNKITDSYLDFNNQVLNILSDESFTAPTRLRINNYGSEIENPINFPEKIKSQIDKIYGQNINYFPVIFIRNQADLIYSQYVEEYNLKKYKNVDMAFDKNQNIDLNGYEIYKFHNYIVKLEEVFGKGRVKVFLFEKWKDNYDEFENYFLTLVPNLDVDIPSLLTSSEFNSKKKTDNGYFIKDGKTLVPFFSDSQNTEIMNFFYEENLKLSEYFPESELKKYRYI